MYFYYTSHGSKQYVEWNVVRDDISVCTLINADIHTCACTCTLCRQVHGDHIVCVCACVCMCVCVH